VFARFLVRDMTYIMVDSINATLKNIASAGGETVTPFTELPNGSGYATFRDPAGNQLGLYQEAR